MMLGERTHHLTPTIQVPPWPLYDDPSYTSYPVSGVTTGCSPRNTGDVSPYLLGDAALTSLRRFLPCNDPYISDEADDSDFADAPVDAYSCDEFRIYEFKVRRCARGRSHDWTECPYAHPGEKARRRDPRKYHYSGTACPDFRKGNCKRGDSCEFAHGVFECWLHPARYRTQPCKDGVNCRRRVCFFAHTPEQLRVLPQSSVQQSPRSSTSPSATVVDSYDGSPLRQQHHHHHLQASFEPFFLSSSPTSTLISPPTSPPSDSPPLSPSGAASVRRASLPAGSSVNELLVSLRQLQLSKGTKSPIGSWGVQQMGTSRGMVMGYGGNSGFGSLPSTPTRMSVMGSGAAAAVSGVSGLFDGWEEPEERVESGRDLRAMMAEKLSKENSLERFDEGQGVTPDVDWVSELVM